MKLKITSKDGGVRSTSHMILIATSAFGQQYHAGADTYAILGVADALVCNCNLGLWNGCVAFNSKTKVTTV